MEGKVERLSSFAAIFFDSLDKQMGDKMVISSPMEVL
jgi:hypothetical protein